MEEREMGTCTHCDFRKSAPMLQSDHSLAFHQPKYNKALEICLLWFYNADQSEVIMSFTAFLILHADWLCDVVRCWNVNCYRRNLYLYDVQWFPVCAASVTCITECMKYFHNIIKTFKTSVEFKSMTAVHELNLLYVKMKPLVYG